MRIPWWGIPTRNTLDRATAMLPQLLYERLDQIGIDVAIAYPTYGLTAIHLTDDELRPALSRAFNIYVAEVYAPYRDRILPVACIPTFTPDEAIAELEHAVGELGLRAVMMGGAIPRPFPGTDAPGARWIDGLGHASAYDYTPLWEKCVELGVSPTFHSTGAGWGARTSPTNYVFNHIGNFAAAGELTARSLFFGGVPMRFPQLRFAFLEGGAAWACNLLSDLLGHWEKRNRDAIGAVRPGRARPGAARTRCSRSTPKAGCATASTGSPTGSPCCRNRSSATTSSTSSRSRAIARPDDIVEIFTDAVLLRMRGRRSDGRAGVRPRAATRTARSSPRCSRATSATGTFPTSRACSCEAWELVERRPSRPRRLPRVHLRQSGRALDRHESGLLRGHCGPVGRRRRPQLIASAGMTSSTTRRK